MMMLKIIGCDHPNKWYANMIGKTVRLISQGHMGTDWNVVMDNDGRLNYVGGKDSEIIDVEEAVAK